MEAEEIEKIISSSSLVSSTKGRGDRRSREEVAIVSSSPSSLL